MDLILDKNSIDHQRGKVKMIFRVFAVSVSWMRNWIGRGEGGRIRANTDFFNKIKDSWDFLTVPLGDFLIFHFT
jgi:hypothetical protein